MARNAASYWEDPNHRQIVLAGRDNDEYRAAIREGLHRVSHILSVKAKEHWLKMWRDPAFRERMAVIRAKQQLSISRLQVSLYQYLDDLHINYQPEYQIGPWTFDCFIADHNILIECQGDYWHSLPKAIRNDKAKAEYITRYFNQYRILYLYEHDFTTKDYVIHRLKHELGLSAVDQIDFNFRDIEMRRVVAADINEFMYKYHYIGPRSHAINLGYYYGPTLVACCSYSGITRRETAVRLGYNPSEVRELCRFCIHPAYHKHNFASWCIAKSTEWMRHNTDAKLLVAFADPAMNHRGTIYKASNWVYDGETEPSYHYVNDDKFVMHKKTLYNNAVKNGLLEREYADRYGYNKIHTPPKRRFIYAVT